MPRIAQHIARPWLWEMMARYPGGRKAISEALNIPLNQLSEYVTADTTPRRKRLIELSKLLGFDVNRFYTDIVA